jgi:hypothetical protein
MTLQLISPLPSSPDVDHVARIAAIENPVIRNLEITECYADLSAAMRTRTGGAADWCTFATWASRQAGRTIRGEDLLDRFKRRLGRRRWVLAPVSAIKRVLLRLGLFQPGTTLGRAVREIHTPFDAFERASAEVARGNLKVFDEIAREFARFMAAVPPDAGDGSPELLAFLSHLRPGPPPDGQDYLRDAFADYQRQRREPDAQVRAARMLLANLRVGLHEQTRLQPQIEAAVRAPIATVEDLGARVLHVLIPGSRSWPRLLQGPPATVVGWIASRVRREAVLLTQEAVTESMMVLTLPHSVLSLAQSLDAPVPAVFGGAQHQFLEPFVKEYDTCPPGGTACGANDWCDLQQRMHYIVHLFRAYADDPSLLSRPFTPQQVASFRGGVVPDGEL